MEPRQIIRAAAAAMLSTGMIIGSAQVVLADSHSPAPPTSDQQSTTTEQAVTLDRGIDSDRNIKTLRGGPLR